MNQYSAIIPQRMSQMDGEGCWALIVFSVQSSAGARPVLRSFVL